MDPPGSSAWARSPANDELLDDRPFSSMMSDLHGGSAPFVPSFSRDRGRPVTPPQASSFFTDDLRSIMSDFAPGLDPVLAPGAIGHGAIGGNRRSDPISAGPSSSRFLPRTPGRTSVYEPIGGLGLPLGIPDGSGTRSCWSAVVDTDRSPSINSITGSVDSLKLVDDSMERELMCLLSEDSSPTPLDARQPSEDPPIFPDLAHDTNDDPLSAAELALQKEQEAQQQQQLSEEDMPRRYKTKRCINFQKYGKCTYGIRCQFAHGVQELRPSVDSDGTNASQDADRAARRSRDSQGDRPRVCWNWANGGNCKFGSTCTYASTHTSDNFGASVAVPVCRFWSQKGYCPYGSKCNSSSTHRPENMPPESERETPSAADFLNLPRQSDPGERLRKFDRSRQSIDSRKGRSSVDSDEEIDPLAGDEYLKLLDKPNEKLEVDSNTRSIDLFKAAGFGSVQRVQGLIDQNVDPNVGVVHGRTPLMQAASWGHAECVRALVAGRADICAKDPGGKTAIFLAQVHNQENCIEVIQQALLQQLAYVCANGGPDQMRTLVDCGADLNTMHMASGQYPLSVAAARKDPQMVVALLQVRTVSNKRVKLDQVDRSTGMSALCHAARANNYGALQALLESNADPKVQDGQSKTALWHAQQTNHAKCAKLLQSADRQRGNPQSNGEAQSSKEKRRSSVKPGANDKGKNSFATLLDQEDSPDSKARKGSPQKALVIADSSSEEDEESSEESSSEEEEVVVRSAKRGQLQSSGSKGKNFKGKSSKNKSRLREIEELDAAYKAENKWLAGWRTGWTLEGQMNGIGVTQLSMLAACIVSVIYITRDVVLHLADLDHITVGGPGEVCVRTLSGSCGVVMIHLCVSLLFPLLGH